ncbi:MAG TPA: CoB--CoM heterodisulfide reductase iron-sulfur subunit B family protein [Thermoleophilia bacterium]|nr:CoB--CoM heterodisulfide reductase iron-sulfur subunit B family protein [Thermoleophilia bacterium]
MTTLAYYPGCSLHSTAKELDSSFDGTMAKLDVDLAEIPGWQCCGNSAAHSANRMLAAALPTNELVKVKDDMKLDAVAVPCAACYNRFQRANHEVNDEAMAADIAEVVGRPYGGGVKVLNLVDVYHDQVGLAALEAKVVKPFQGLKVASYYGCLLTRPPKVTLAEDPEYPVHMDAVLKAIGCIPVDWDSKTDCCGAGLTLCEPHVVDKLVKRIITNARERGAQAIACACPLCQINLDSRQGEIKKTDGAWIDMPILYLSQLVGHAIGVRDALLGLQKALVDVTRVLA